MEHRFKEFSDAKEFAQKSAKETGTSVKIQRNSDGFVVETTSASHMPSVDSEVFVDTKGPATEFEDSVVRDIISEKLSELRIEVVNEIDEKQLVRSLIAGIDSIEKDLKSMHANPDEKLKSQIAGLKSVFRSIENFIFILDDIEQVRTAEEASDVMAELWGIMGEFPNTGIEKRIQKEIRELSEKARELPSEHKIRSTAATNHAIAILNASAPQCRRCGANMVVREGNGDYFWGCSTFPTEFCPTKRLSKAEREKLNI